jgi:hypothetical protein
MAGKGQQFTFHGAFGTKADAVKKERQVGGFIRETKVRGQKRYMVMTKNPPPRRARKNPLMESLAAGAAAGGAAALIGHAANRKRKRNQAGAAEMYEIFHGREPREVITMQEAAVKKGDYAALGDLCGLWLRPVKKNTPPTSWPPPEIQFSKSDGVKLCCDAKGKQLFFIGGDQQISPDDLAALCEAGDAETMGKGNICCIGQCHGISYQTQKSFDDFRTIEYVHQFGEETDERPILCYDLAAKRFLLAGGAYSIAGLDDSLGASPGIVN